MVQAATRDADRPLRVGVVGRRRHGQQPCPRLCGSARREARRMPLCENNPWPGEPIIVAIPEGTARSHIMLPALLPPNIRERFSTVISDVATTGNSGSGVFDAGQKCLLDIMSRKSTYRRTVQMPEARIEASPNIL
jgi:hypothetical protein